MYEKVADYQKNVQQLIQELQSNEVTGLSEQEASDRLLQNGSNDLSSASHYDSLIIIFLKQFRSSLIFILVLAACLVFISGHHFDAFIVTGILLFNALIGAFHEKKAQTILKSLLHYWQPTCVVIRDGNPHIIPASKLVKGDVIKLQEGEQVPADGRLIQAYNLKVDESFLTGESVAVEKITEPIVSQQVLADQKNMVFKGTYVVSGNGYALITHTGNSTEIGKLKKITEQEISRDFPLKKKLDDLSQLILISVLVLCLILFALGISMQKPFFELLALLASLFICIIPEGLPLVFTLALVRGARKMAKHNLLIKKLQAAEALGITDVIIIDKTGTITRNEMVIIKLFMNDKNFSVTGNGYQPEGLILLNGTPSNDQSLTFLAQICALLNQTTSTFNPETNLYTIKGEPIEAAMGVLSEKILKDFSFKKEYTKFYQLPFNYKTRAGAVFFYHKDSVIAVASGSPETILNSCNNTTKEATQAVSDYYAEGLRVVAIAYKKTTREQFEALGTKNLYEDWIFNDATLGAVIGIQDALRPEVADVILNTRKAGIKVIMATGDYKDTALAVAKKVHIFDENDHYLEGKDLEKMTESELINILPKVTVFARVTPEQKLTIVKLYQKLGAIVTMTGDGINDAPALAAADLGAAMGNIGTEVAKQAADIILLDDSFVSIVEAIKEGRNIFFTLRRVTFYFFITNCAEVFLVLFSLILNLPLPLLPAQILWLNLVTDGFLDVSLTEERQEENLLERSIKSEKLIDTTLMLKIIYLSLPMTFISLAVFYAYKDDLKLARTMTLTLMALFQWFNSWNCRSETKSILTLGLFTNVWLVRACAFVFFLQVAVLYIPFFQKIFQTTPLSLYQLLFIIALSSSILAVEELRKFVVAHL